MIQLTQIRDYRTGVGFRVIGSEAAFAWDVEARGVGSLPLAASARTKSEMFANRLSWSAMLRGPH